MLFVFGPWLLFGLMLAAPFAVAVAIDLVFAATVVVAAICALLASPVLLLRELRNRPAPRAVSLPAITTSPASVWPVSA